MMHIASCTFLFSEDKLHKVIDLNVSLCRYYEGANDINMMCMQTKQNDLTKTRISRLRAQGYLKQTDGEICELALGHRFAIRVCTTLVGIGVVTANIPILVGMTLVALGGVILPYHPFDYIYNHLLSRRLNKTKVPPRSKQFKFACVVASTGLSITSFLFYMDYTTAGYILGVSLFMVALTVSTTDFCIPSKIYNFLFKVKIDKTVL